MKIIGVNVNYASRREELGNVKVGDEPIIFMKPDSSILKDGKPFSYLISRKKFVFRLIW